MVARQQSDERAILLCALFGYGSAKAIVRFLSSLDFRVLEGPESSIRRGLDGRYYRFQTNRDVVEAFCALHRLERGAMRSIFMEHYKKNRRVIDGVFALIEAIDARTTKKSRGIRFLFGNVPERRVPISPYKRWMMFLRWMVRKDSLDLGLWEDVDRRDLVIPLDTHTFHTGRRLGLIRRKSYDWKAAVELTEALRSFDPDDPVRYDFALYRWGQEKIVV